MDDPRIDNMLDQKPDHEPEKCPWCEDGKFTEIGGGAGAHHSYHSPVDCPACEGTGWKL